MVIGQLISLNLVPTPWNLHCRCRSFGLSGLVDKTSPLPSWLSIRKQGWFSVGEEELQRTELPVASKVVHRLQAILWAPFLIRIWLDQSHDVGNAAAYAAVGLSPNHL